MPHTLGPHAQLQRHGTRSVQRSWVWRTYVWLQELESPAYRQHQFLAQVFILEFLAHGFDLVKQIVVAPFNEVLYQAGLTVAQA